MIGFRNVQRAPAVRRLNELGASLVEYALLLALIAVVCIGAVQYFGQANDTGLNHSKECIERAHAGDPIPADCN